MNAHGVLITGVYGTGKSSVVEEIAGLLEDAGLSYGAIDLDWLMWFDVDVDEAAREQVFLANLAVAVPIQMSAVEIATYLLADAR